MATFKHLKEFQEPQLRGIVDETLEQRVPGFADRFLPDGQTYSTTFAYDVIKKTNHIAAMIGFGAEPPVMDRDAVAQRMGKLAKFGLKYVVTEEELLALNQARSNSERQNMIDRLTIKAADLVNALAQRVDVAKAEAIAKGSLSYDKNGVKVSVDFGIPAEHKIALSSSDDWSNQSHDIIGDLLEWVQTYEDANGQQPDVILVSREVQALMLKNSVIVTEAGRPEGSTRVSEQELQSVLGGYGLPPVEVVLQRKITARNVYTGEDETIEFFPVNRVVMVSQGVGEFLYGPTVENNYQPGIVLQAYDKGPDPIESVLRVAAVGFPVIENPYLLFHADVYTP